MSRGWTNLLTRKDIIAKLEKFVIHLPKEKEQLLQEKISLDKIFPTNSRSTELEIGCGKGEFIAHKSASQKATNFLGIEVKPKRIVSIVQKLDLLTTDNVRLLQLFLDQDSIKVLPAGSFVKIYINYPDPWPKAKHHKNRLINPQFISLLPDLLANSGILQIITDDQDYAQQIAQSLDSEKKLKQVGEKERKSLLANRQTTYFEKLKSEQGFAPNIFLYQKI